MAETLESKKTTTTNEAPNTEIDEKTITTAMRGRIGHFKDQADSLTLEGVRRLLERDLGLEEFALDAHKCFIKQCLQECFDAASSESVSKSSGGTGEEIVNSTEEETLDTSEKLQPHQEVEEQEGKEDLQGSPVLGLLSGVDTKPNGKEETKEVASVKEISEDAIKKTVRKRASYFRTNSETLSMAGARRLLEEDLELDKHALDPYRELIKVELDKVMQSSGVAEPTIGVKNNKRKKASGGQGSESLDSMDEEEETKPKKKVAPKQKIQYSDGTKNRKGSVKQPTKSGNKQKKPVESMSGESDDAKDDGDLSEDGSQSSVEEPVKKKSQAPTQTYGKRVEHLKSVIRSCGMSVPPNVYKKVKQEPEAKREACLIKELEEMLKKEGLSANPSEKEIKEVKKRKQTTKELEGIDFSNIVSSSRRRSTSSFVALPPKPPSISDGSADDDAEEEEVDSDNNDDDEDNTDDGNEDDDSSSSEDELNEDDEDSSD